MAENELLATARAWLDAEPDNDIRTELDELITLAEAGDDVELTDRFAGRLQFGTAGLRAAVAAGPATSFVRLNRCGSVIGLVGSSVTRTGIGARSTGTAILTTPSSEWGW